MSTSDNISSSFSEDKSLASQAPNLLTPGIQECDTLQVYINCTMITSHIESDTCCLQWSNTTTWLKTRCPLKEPIPGPLLFSVHIHTMPKSRAVVCATINILLYKRSGI